MDLEIVIVPTNHCWLCNSDLDDKSSVVMCKCKTVHHRCRELWMSAQQIREREMKAVIDTNCNVCGEIYLGMEDAYFEKYTYQTIGYLFILILFVLGIFFWSSSTNWFYLFFELIPMIAITAYIYSYFQHAREIRELKCSRRKISNK